MGTDIDAIQMDYNKWVKQIAALDKRLSEMDNKVVKNVLDTVLKEAAETLSAEQKRILASAPSEGIRSFANDLSVWKDPRGMFYRKKAVYRAGYPYAKTSKSPKYFIVEFGRPGRKGRKKDKKNRHIGRVEQYSHIRAAWFGKRDAIRNMLIKRSGEEISRLWKGR